MRNTEKKDYIPPKVSVTFVEVEQGIAAGSASVEPKNLVEIWTDGGDLTGK